MGKTNVSIEVLILFLFTEQAHKKQQKTHTPGSMKKTNVSSEVLILPKQLEKKNHQGETEKA